MIPNQPKATPSTPPTLARSRTYTSHPAPYTPPYKCMYIWLISFHCTTWWWPKFVAETCSCALRVVNYNLMLTRCWDTWLSCNKQCSNTYKLYVYWYTYVYDGFGGLVVSMLVSGSNSAEAVGLSDVKILSIPSSGEEVNNLSHVPALRHVKEPTNLRELRIAS